jgi:hypothetical protein
MDLLGEISWCLRSIKKLNNTKSSFELFTSFDGSFVLSREIIKDKIKRRLMYKNIIARCPSNKCKLTLLQVYSN